jgi:hypothetical protein
MKTIKLLTTKINGVNYEAEIYRNCHNDDYFFVNDQPVDMKVLFHSDTINGYIVIAEDDYGQRMVWECEEVEA